MVKKKKQENVSVFMSEEPEVKKNPPHRPVKPIDWKLVDQLLLAGCNGPEVASHFHIHPDTFYDRVQKDQGMTYTSYALEMLKKGDSLLRSKQMEKALEKDNTMLVWLGKNRLGQRDEPREERSPNHILIAALLEQVKDLRGKLGLEPLEKSPTSPADKETDQQSKADVQLPQD